MTLQTKIKSYQKCNDVFDGISGKIKEVSNDEYDYEKRLHEN